MIIDHEDIDTIDVFDKDTALDVEDIDLLPETTEIDQP